MATAYHTFGPCAIKTNTNAGALELLGYTEDGGDIAITYHERPIYTDISGPETPAEKQYMGESAVIRVRMPVIDQAVLDKSLQQTDATTAAPGEQGTTGLLLGTGGYLKALALVPPSGSAESPWHFQAAKLVSHRRKEGSVATYVELEWHAFVFISGTATTRKDLTLYTRTVS